jgi:hypothetical protein
VISVKNINKLEDYGNLLTYLQRLAVTKDVSIIKVNDKEVQLELSLNGTLIQFKQSLSLNNKLLEIEVSKLVEKSVFSLTDTTPDESITYFTWRP